MSKQQKDLLHCCSNLAHKCWFTQYACAKDSTLTPCTPPPPLTHTPTHIFLSCRFDEKLQLELYKEIELRQAEEKRKNLENQSHNAILVNVQRVKHGYYSSAVTKIKQDEKALRSKERQEISAQRRREVMKEEHKKASVYLKEVLERQRNSSDVDRILKEQAEILRLKMSRTKQWLGLLALMRRTQLWSAKVTSDSKELKRNKIRNDAALRIQILARNRSYMIQGQRFREAVKRLRMCVKKFIGIWRDKRLRRAADTIRTFLYNENNAPFKWMIKNFIMRVLNCQRTWRGFNVCTQARIHLLKLYWNKCEDVIFARKKKELIVEANKRKSMQTKEHRAKLHKVNGEHGVGRNNGGGNIGENLKAIQVGLKASIKKARSSRASAEIKTQFCKELLRAQRHKFRDSLASFTERQRAKELSNVRSLSVDDAKKLFTTGRVPHQLLVNVGIATGHMDRYFDYGFSSDDAFLLLGSIDKEDMISLVARGIQETENRKWNKLRRMVQSGVMTKSRGLDKTADADSLPNFVRNDDNILRNMHKAMMEMVDMDVRGEEVAERLLTEEESDMNAVVARTRAKAKWSKVKETLVRNGNPQAELARRGARIKWNKVKETLVGGANPKAARTKRENAMNARLKWKTVKETIVGSKNPRAAIARKSARNKWSKVRDTLGNSEKLDEIASAEDTSKGGIMSRFRIVPNREPADDKNVNPADGWKKFVPAQPTMVASNPGKITVRDLRLSSRKKRTSYQLRLG